MKKNICSIEILLEYIGYLVDYSESVLSTVIISDNEYSSLFLESELFCKRVIESEIISPGLMEELIQAKLLKITEEFSIKTYLKSLIKRNKYKYYSNNSELENQRRENLLLYRDRMKNIYDLVLSKA